MVMVPPALLSAARRARNPRLSLEPEPTFGEPMPDPYPAVAAADRCTYQPGTLRCILPVHPEHPNAHVRVAAVEGVEA